MNSNYSVYIVQRIIEMSFLRVPPNPQGWRRQESSKNSNFLPEVDPPLAEYISIFAGLTEKLTLSIVSVILLGCHGPFHDSKIIII